MRVLASYWQICLCKSKSVRERSGLSGARFLNKINRKSIANLPVSALGRMGVSSKQVRIEIQCFWSLGHLLQNCRRASAPEWASLANKSLLKFNGTSTSPIPSFSPNGYH